MTTLIDLDDQIAREVMGWELCTKTHDSGATRSWWATGRGVMHPWEWAPTLNMAKAWWVVDRMQKLGYAMRLCTYTSGEKADCTFFANGPTGLEQVSHAYDMPTKAICLAALDAVRAQST